MRLELTGRHLEITPTLRRLVDTRLEKLERLLNDRALSAQVVLTREKNRLKAEITLHARGEKFLHGVSTSNSCAISLSQAAAKISQQARKIKGKWEERKRRGLGRTPAADAAREPEPQAARRRDRMPKVFHSTRQAVRPMSVPDAVR
jgi:ribosomal subunit interface protein